MKEPSLQDIAIKALHTRPKPSDQLNHLLIQRDKVCQKYIHSGTKGEAEKHARLIRELNNRIKLMLGIH